MSEASNQPRSTFYNIARTSVGSNLSRQRTLSSSSIDPYEDPVVGLERVTHTQVRRRPRRTENSDVTEGRRELEEDHALSSKYESLNYEICENQLYRDAESKSGHQLNLKRIQLNRWVACFLIGICTAFAGVVIDILVHKSADFKFNYILQTLVDKCDDGAEIAGGGCMWLVQVAWMAYNCIMVFIAACLVIFWAPIAAGSGIPQIKCFLNGIHIPEVVHLKTLVVKVFGVSAAVAGGLCAGKEGPMIHSGGAIGAGISQGKLHNKLDPGFFREFRNDREKRDFVSAGAAAGVAAAFGAPIGGVLFAIEEGASFWNQALTWRMFFSAMIASFTLNATLTYYFNQDGLLSWNGLANFGVFQDKNYTIWEIPLFLMIGVIGGCTGALFNVLNYKISEFRKKYVSNKWQRLLEALLVAAVSAFTGFVTLFIVDDCVPIGLGMNKTEGLNRLYCQKGEYSAVANLFFANPEESVKSLFHSPIGSFKPQTLLIFAIEYFVLSVWTFGLAVPSGVFIPALLTGAAWGRLFGLGVEKLLPQVTGIDPGKYALMGAAAQLGGVVRMTISLTAILLEATKDMTFGLPIMLVLMIAKWVGDFLSEGLYDLCIELSEVPLLGWNAPKMARNITASTVMRSDLVAMEKRVRVGRVLEILAATSHHAFPLVDRIDESDISRLPDYGKLEGYILRTQLVSIIKKRAYRQEWEEDLVGSMMTEQDFIDVDSKDEKLEVGEDDEMAWIDLSPYMHPHPHRVPLNASLPFIYRLFRGLGLRYLMVVNEDNRLRGIITRKDVARFRNTKGFALRELYISDHQF
ncbi:clh-6 [Pristionchus pacificus]|nr:clh-6 [Pristionchus pacificus]